MFQAPCTHIEISQHEENFWRVLTDRHISDHKVGRNDMTQQECFHTPLTEMPTFKNSQVGRK